jgi:ATP phosphoribosyltransferase regulatory subunit HisZ
MDLREVVAAVPVAEPRAAVLAPYLPQDQVLQRRITALRKAAEVVVIDLPGHEKSHSELGCDRKLKLRNGKWVVEKASER